MKKTNLLLIPAIALLGSSLCSAAVYNVNYLGGRAPASESSLQGVIGSTGETWNQATGNFTNLNDSAGGTSTIGISGIQDNNDNNDTISGLTIFSGNASSFGKGVNRTITITGLTLNGLYDIYIYALSHNTGSWADLNNTERAAGSFITTNTSGNGQTQALENGNTGTNATNFTLGSNYVLFQSIVADGAGNISIIADAKDNTLVFDPLNPSASNATRLHVNGLQIAAVPETSSAALLGLGAFALLLRRRK